MNHPIKLQLPTSLMQSGFVRLPEEITVEPAEYSSWNGQAIRYFIYEQLHANGTDGYLPWQDFQALKKLAEAWSLSEEKLEALYGERNRKEAEPLMEDAICMCFSFLFWLNDEPVALADWKTKAETFTYVPVNFTERMDYIIARPSLYQSYKAIQQIMIELEKLAAKKSIKLIRKQ
ncbi:MAG: YpoC family protein [Bacillus sp. (in: firmicutes)]